MAYFENNGAKIFYDILGDKNSSKNVVFLNGVMASTNSWSAQVDTFKELGYKIIVHDFIGQLKSDKIKETYSFAEHAKDLKDLLDYLKITSANLIGTSYGGEVAMKFSVLYPSYVKTLNIIDSVSEIDDLMESFIDSWIIAAKKLKGEDFFNIMAPSIYGNDYMKNNKEFLKDRAKNMDTLPKSYFEGQIKLYETFKNDVFMTDEIDKIKAPTMIICGEKDYLKRKKFSKMIHEKIENSQYVTIPDSGHVSIFEKAKEVNTILAGFILLNEK